MEGGGEEIVCTDVQTLKIQQSFQNCSHEISTAVYEASLQIESTKLLASKLCKALTDIGSVCVKHLRECFARDDVVQMKKSSLTEMKDFLIRIVNGKVEADALDDCKAGLDAVNTLEEYDDESEEDYVLTNLGEPQVVLQGGDGKKGDEMPEKEEKDVGSQKDEVKDAVDSSAATVGSGKEHRSVGEVEEVTTEVKEVPGEVKKETDLEESEKGKGKEEAVRRVRPVKVQGRTGSSSEKLSVTISLLLIPIFFVNL